MTAYYDILDALKADIETYNTVNTIHEGWLFKVDLSKETIFPLCNIDVASVDFDAHTTTFNMQIVFADILDETKENEKDVDNTYHGSDNLQDIYNTQLASVNLLQTSMRRGNLLDVDYVLNNDESITATPFEQRFENLLVGWTIEFSVEVPNDEISIC